MAIRASTIYLTIVVALRIIGSRALARMSGQDMVVTVALGSLVASVPITAGPSLVDGIAALVTFLVLQALTRVPQARFLPVHPIVRERPRLLLWDGEVLEDRVGDIAVTADEVRAAVRHGGATRQCECTRSRSCSRTTASGPSSRAARDPT